MTIYSLAVDFINTLLGADIAATARGALVAEYFGYLVVGIVIFLLVKVAVWLVSYPINVFRKQ
ncbi:MAG: hypothetical protein J6Q89_04630 [Clostridia bacterium]|nr:hypothetical protein [Clostridia bacterium]